MVNVLYTQTKTFGSLAFFSLQQRSYDLNADSPSVLFLKCIYFYSTFLLMFIFSYL